MKRIALTIITTILLLSSCATQIGYKETNVIDYSNYYKQGFFLSESNSVSFNYEPIGSVVSVVKGDKQIIESIDTVNTDTKYSVKTRRDLKVNKTSISYSVYDALDEIIGKSKSLGANGIINLKIRFTYDKDYGKGYEITGMAIKK